MKTKKDYWVSNQRGEKDCFTSNTLSEVKAIISKNLSDIILEDGKINGGYTLQKANGSSVVSNGEFRIENNKIKYFPDYTEEQL